LPVAAAQATPEDKLRVMSQAQERGEQVAVVGDGINDAPVLAKADVSVALDQGSALAQSQADLIVLNGRLTGLPEAVAHSRFAMRIVKQNLAWAAVYNFACIPLALMGLLPPWAAGLGMALSSLGVVLNSLRLGTTRWKSSTS
jgi:Cu2+-exporting ATPase